MSTLATHLNTVRTTIFKYPITKKYAEIVEEKTKVNAEYFVVGFLALITLLLFIGSDAGAEFIANFVGFAYPMYATIRAIESDEKEDDTDWLVYWVVFSFFHLIENFADIVVYWIPFFYPLKVTFLLWCMLPQYKGAHIIYVNVIKPLFDKHSATIDEALNSFSSKKTETKKTD